MPGIFGIISQRNEETNRAELELMLGCLLHEPFYRHGTLVDRGLGLYAGWTSIVGAPEHLPVDECKERGLTILFSGEDFNAPGPGDMRSDSPTRIRSDHRRYSYLAELYNRYGQSFPCELNGWFHGIVADRERGRVFLFNDCFGFQRLYFHCTQDAFYFSCEAKSILRVRPELRRIDEGSLSDFITCGCVLNGRTFFPGINILPGGSCWKFNGQSLENKFQYFKPDAWEDLAPLEEPDFIKNLVEMLPSIVKRYANDNGRVALSLTGGLDTRIILAYAKPSPGSLPCYTFGGEKGESRDVHLAGIVAKACMQPHTILRIRRDFFEQFQDLAQRTVYMTDGCHDVGGAAELYLNRMARDIAPIRLTGNYGSEVLRLIVAFGYHEPTPGLFHNDLKKIFARSEKNFLEAKKGNLRSFILFKQVPWYHYNRLAIEQSQLMLRSPFLDKNLLQLLYRAPPNTSKDETLSLRLIERGDRNLARIPTDRGAGGHGIHSRIGVLKGLEWLLFRAEYLFDYGMPNWLSRVDRFLAPIRLEDLFTGRHRFYNLRSWYRNELAPFVKEILLDPTSLNRPYLERKLVEKMVQEHVNGVGNYSIEINQLITLEYTHRLFVDNR